MKIINTEICGKKENYKSKNIIKNHLHQIIRNAYFEEPEDNLKRYLNFTLEFSHKIRRSYSGLYYELSHKIVIYDLSLSEANNVCTLLHELSHHIEYMKTGQTGHQKTFYKEFKKLLYSAIDLNKISLDEALNLSHRNTDYNKVIKMLKEYRYSPPRIKVQNHLYTIKAMNSYSIKEKLKSKGYLFNPVGKSWDKIELNKEQVEEEKKDLIEMSVNLQDIIVIDAHALNMKGYYTIMNEIDIENSKGYICVSGNTYTFMNEIRNQGFRWYPEEKTWKKYITCDIDDNQIQSIIKKIKSIVSPFHSNIPNTSVEVSYVSNLQNENI